MPATTVGGQPRPRCPPAVRRPAMTAPASTPGIVHLGIGAFHRAHQAVYVDDCLAAGETRLGHRRRIARSPETRDALGPQDGLYTLAIRDDRPSAARHRLGHRASGGAGDPAAPPRPPGRPAHPHRHADRHGERLLRSISAAAAAPTIPTSATTSPNPPLLAPRSASSPRRSTAAARPALRRSRVLSCDNLPAQRRTRSAASSAQFAPMRGGDLAAYVEDGSPAPPPWSTASCRHHRRRPRDVSRERSAPTILGR